MSPLLSLLLAADIVMVNIVQEVCRKKMNQLLCWIVLADVTYFWTVEDWFKE